MRHGVVLEAVLIEPAHLAVDEHELARTWAAYDEMSWFYQHGEMSWFISPLMSTNWPELGRLTTIHSRLQLDATVANDPVETGTRNTGSNASVLVSVGRTSRGAAPRAPTSER